MPRLVVLSLLVTILLLGALGYVLCRYDLQNSTCLNSGKILMDTSRNAGRRNGRLRNSHTGFQKIRSTDQFTDSEDDEIEFDK